jgi:hypothetical protein
VVTQIACSFTHSVAVTQEGLLFTWGLGIYGALGLGGNLSFFLVCFAAFFLSTRYFLSLRQMEIHGEFPRLLNIWFLFSLLPSPSPFRYRDCLSSSLCSVYDLGRVVCNSRRLWTVAHTSTHSFVSLLPSVFFHGSFPDVP